MYGATVLIADGGSKSYSLEASSYYVTLNFYKQGRGVYTMTVIGWVLAGFELRVESPFQSTRINRSLRSERGVRAPWRADCRT